MRTFLCELNLIVSIQKFNRIPIIFKFEEHFHFVLKGIICRIIFKLIPNLKNVVNTSLNKG